MEEKTEDHYEDDRRIDLEEQGGQDGDPHFDQLEEVKNRLAPPAGALDMRRAVAKIIRKARGQPQRQNEVHQHRLKDLVGLHHMVLRQRGPPEMRRLAPYSIFARGAIAGAFSTSPSTANCDP